MKKLVNLFFLIFSLFLLGCSSCTDDPPKVLLVNNGTDKADIQIKTSGGNTENVNGINTGESSEWRTFDAGKIEFTISISGVSEDALYTLEADLCNEYTVTIHSDNSVSSAGVPVEK